MIRRYYRVSAINILPEEFRPRYLTRLEGALLVVLAIGLVGLVVSFQRLSAEKERTADLVAQERRLVAASRELAPRVQQAEQLRQETTALEAALAKALKGRESILAPRLAWALLLSGVLVSPPEGIELLSLELLSPPQAPRQLKVSGASHGGFGGLAQYYERLSRTTGVSKVNIDKTEMREEPDKPPLLHFVLTLELAE